MEGATSNTQNPMFNNSEKETLKPLPYAAKKQKVYKWYPRTPDEKIKSIILYCQKLIYPHLSEKELKYEKWLSMPVLKEIIKYEGAPAGYQKEYE